MPDLSPTERGRPCCDMHNHHCEPPGDLCCWDCTEASHPAHPQGEQCVLDRLAEGGTQ